MTGLLIKDIFEHSVDYMDRSIAVNGWVKTKRVSKSLGFIELNDGTCFKNLQIVFDESLENFEAISKLQIGSGISVKGDLIKSEGTKQAFELKAKGVEILAASSEDYPIQKKRHTFEYLRTIAHLRPRSNTFNAVFRVRSILSFAIHQFFQDRGFVYVHTPLITGSDCEGAGEMFHVTSFDLNKVPKSQENQIDYTQDFFGKETNLTVSGQLEGEAYSMAFKNIYTFGPTFRAENSNTARHASEFWMVEPEIAFAELKDDMDLAEDMIKFIANAVLKKAPDEMAFFNQFIEPGVLERLQLIVNSNFERMTYTQAVDYLQKAKVSFQYPVEWGMNLQTEHERYLSEEIVKKPVFVTDYPKEIKAFYMRQNDDGKTVAAADLLVPGVGEIIGGSQREERLDVLQKKMSELGLKHEDYWWYLDLRKYGGVKHAGFGLGLERALMYMTGMKNIRDVIPFPRTPGNADF